MSPARRPRVLVADDDRAILRLLAAALSGAGYTVTEAATGRQAIERAAQADLMVLDLGLPDMDGRAVIEALRDGGATIPILVLSSHHQEQAKVTALDLGADDYLTKPFGVPELLARLRAAERHRLQQHGEQPVFRLGALRIDMVRRQVSLAGAAVRLSAREYNLLRLLAVHAGKVLTHKFIQQQIWGGETDVQYLRIYVRALRQKIEPVPEAPQYLLTEFGVGYRLCAPELLAAAPPPPG